MNTTHAVTLSHAFSWLLIGLPIPIPRRPSGKPSPEKSLMVIAFMFWAACVLPKNHPTKRTLEPKMAPGLFIGWRIDSGFRYRYVTQGYRTRGASCVFDVSKSELYLPDGDDLMLISSCFFQAPSLVRGNDPNDIRLPEMALKNVLFPLDGGMAFPSTPGPKTRSVYITLDRIIKFRETPGCKGCTNKTRYHTNECRARFQKLVGEEKKMEESLSPSR